MSAHIEFRGVLMTRAEVEEIWTDALDASLRDLPPAVMERVEATLDLCEQALCADEVRS